MSTIKGSGLRGARAWLQAELGSDVDGFLEGAPPDLQRLMRDQVVLAGSKYPRSQLHEIFERMAEWWPPDVLARLARMGAHIAQEDLGGVYSILLKIGSVDGTLRILTRVWGRYFDEGTAALVGTTPRAYTFEVVDPSLHPLHPHLIGGYIRRAVELAGGKVVNVDYRSGSRAHQHMFHVRWR